MRFSALQEDGYGADLGQERLPNDVDGNMMAATCDAEAGGNNVPEDGSMISNLPLLFADGYPTSLEKITLPQLERFITFMVQCSFGHDTAEVIGEPHWWPKEVKFSNPFVRPKKVNDTWMGNLKKLVFRCYTYHRSEYLLRFCSYLSQYPRDKLQYVNNWDSTTSLYHKGTGKLLVTFRNENMNYDKKMESPRRLLLSRNGITPGTTNKMKQQHQPQIMVQPLSDDIYLCDNCDAEFVGLEKMKEHEKTCCEQEHCSGNSRPITPDISVTHPQTAQNQFLDYFQLRSRDTCKPPAIRAMTIDNRALSIPSRTSRRIRGSVNLARCPTIPFSSPAGIALAKKSKMMTEGTQQERLDRIERHLSAPPLNSASRPRWLDKVTEYNRWIITYKSNRGKDSYVHEYKFKSFKEKPMLSLRSQLLCVACQHARIVLVRLNSEQIEEIKRNLPKSQNAVRRVLPRVRPRSESGSSVTSIVPLKRKAHGNEDDPIVIDDEEAEALTMATLTPIGAIDSSTVKTTKTTNPINSTIEISSVKLPLDKVPQSKATSTAIAVIDLCSSDEEESPNGPVVSDENRDPMGSSNANVSSSFTMNITPSKFCANARGCTANSTSDWSNKVMDRRTDSVLDNENDNCEHRSPSDVILKTRFPSVLSATP